MLGSFRVAQLVGIVSIIGAVLMDFIVNAEVIKYNVIYYKLSYYAQFV